MSHSATGNFADASDNQMEEGVRGCTCPPSERPEPCMKKYALSDCHKAASTAWAARVIQEECDKVEKSNEPS